MRRLKGWIESDKYTLHHFCDHTSYGELEEVSTITIY